MKLVYRIDENGFLQFGQDLIIKETEDIPTNYTNIPLPKDINGNQLPFYKPHLMNGTWVEYLTQEEIDALNNQPKEPTEIDYLIDLDFRLSMLELGI